VKKKKIMKKCRKILEHYGFKHQLRKLIEELGELRREAKNYTAIPQLCQQDMWYENFADELADVQIMVNQFKTVFGSVVDARIEYKIKRQLKRIKKEKKEQK